MSKNAHQLSKPPLNMLLNPTVLKAKKPWEIDVVSLLELFTDFLETKGEKNLRLCANAALSSSLLYRLKVETFFIFEKLRNGIKILSDLEVDCITTSRSYHAKIVLTIDEPRSCSHHP